MENEVREPAPKYNYISREDYLLKERVSEEKHEYFDGHIIAIQTIHFSLTLEEIYDGTGL